MEYKYCDERQDQSFEFKSKALVQFVIPGVTVFKPSADCFDVVILAADSDGDLSHAPVPLAVSSDVCEHFLDLSPEAYVNKAAGLSKKEAKELKNDLCMRFQNFCGKMTVRAIALNRNSQQSTVLSPQPSSQKSQSSSGALLYVIKALELTKPK